jgi:hypothetical protein
MRATCTMYVTARGGIRCTKTRGKVNPGEVAFDVEVFIPQSVFIEPHRKITVQVPGSNAAPVEIEATAFEVWADDGGPCDPEPEAETYADRYMRNQIGAGN